MSNNNSVLIAILMVCFVCNSLADNLNEEERLNKLLTVNGLEARPSGRQNTGLALLAERFQQIKPALEDHADENEANENNAQEVQEQQQEEQEITQEPQQSEESDSSLPSLPSRQEDDD